MAAKLGLRLFDVILAVNGQAVNTVENLRTILAKSPIKWLLTINGKGGNGLWSIPSFGVNSMKPPELEYITLFPVDAVRPLGSVASKYA